MTFQPIVCWTEIPVSKLDDAVAFYNAVFQWNMDINLDMGPNPIAVFDNADTAAGGHLYVGKPSAGGSGSTVHLTVKDNLEAAAERCKAAGGTILGEPVDIPSGRFVYAADPDGNSLGMFELKG